MSYAYERLGNHWMQVKDPAQALDMYVKMLEFNQRAVEQDPANRPLLMGQAVCYDKIAKASQRVGKLDEAGVARKQAAQIRSRMARKAE